MSFFTSAVRLESTQQHPSALDEPYDRLARTAQVLSTIGFGSKRDADRVTARAASERPRRSSRARRRVPRRRQLSR
jgi:uncharacterized protein (DUF2236 family)